MDEDFSDMVLMRVPGEPGAAVGGEAVFLEAAVGFAGEGALDEAESEGGHQVAIPKI
jgi:hypothetical protein